jgi:ketopantoate reductase
MKIAFLGTGAIGASLVRALYLNKIPFTILVRDKMRKADLLRNGIRYRLKSMTHIELAGENEVRTIAEGKKYDYIFLGMKTPHLKEAGKTTIVPGAGATATVTFRDVGDTKDRVVADMNGSERLDVSLDGE